VECNIEHEHEHEHEHDDTSRVATFWSELVAIAEVTARALRRGVTVGTNDESHAGTIADSTTRATVDRAVRCGMFQVIGLDVMLDAAHRPWVLEVNARPALTGTEAEMKQRLVRAILVSLPGAGSPNGVVSASEHDSPPGATAPKQVDGIDPSLLRLRCFNERA
jgi:hypothetical protein